jgi:hypothetical protein
VGQTTTYENGAIGREFDISSHLLLMSLQHMFELTVENRLKCFTDHLTVEKKKKKKKKKRKKKKSLLSAHQVGVVVKEILTNAAMNASGHVSNADSTQYRRIAIR